MSKTDKTKTPKAKTPKPKVKAGPKPKVETQKPKVETPPVPTPPAAEETYQHILAWCRMTQQKETFTKRLLKKAHKEEAPKLATYYDTIENRWHTLRDCPTAARRLLQNYLA